MKIAERMQSIRDGFPECCLVAYADLSTGMILSVSADTPPKQEAVNALSETAMATLVESATGDLGAFFADGQHPGVFEAVIMEGRETGVFLKSSIRPSEAFCCVCAPNIALSEFLLAARAALEATGEDP